MNLSHAPLPRNIDLITFRDVFQHFQWTSPPLLHGSSPGGFVCVFFPRPTGMQLNSIQFYLPSQYHLQYIFTLLLDNSHLTLSWTSQPCKAYRGDSHFHSITWWLQLWHHLEWILIEGLDKEIYSISITQETLNFCSCSWLIRIMGARLYVTQRKTKSRDML